MIYFRARKVFDEPSSSVSNQSHGKALYQPRLRPAPKQGVSPGLRGYPPQKAQAIMDRFEHRRLSRTSVAIALICLVTFWNYFAQGP